MLVFTVQGHGEVGDGYVVLVMLALVIYMLVMVMLLVWEMLLLVMLATRWAEEAGVGGQRQSLLRFLE